MVYRCSPADKGRIGLIVRENFKDKITLAIGDGANDVNMIQTAHIGVGIFGKEGNQAACFSDFAIPYFKVLRKLLFWHGRSFGVRFSNFVKWYLWKNALLTFTIFFFNLNNGFSASSPTDDTFYALYQITCTSIALLVYFISDQQVDMRFSNNEQSLGFKLSHFYKHCRASIIERASQHYWIWLLLAFVTSLCLFYVPNIAY